MPGSLPYPVSHWLEFAQKGVNALHTSRLYHPEPLVFKKMLHPMPCGVVFNPNSM